MQKDYRCSICGRQNVKLWRPYMDTTPLICAKCAEEKQAEMQYNEVKWEKIADRYIGKWTGRKLPLPRWEVNDKGKVPSYFGPGPEELPERTTDHLIVNLKDLFKNCSSGETKMIPAVPSEDDNFWGYTSVPADLCKWWEELPTK